MGVFVGFVESDRDCSVQSAGDSAVLFVSWNLCAGCGDAGGWGTLHDGAAPALLVALDVLDL